MRCFKDVLVTRKEVLKIENEPLQCSLGTGIEYLWLLMLSNICRFSTGERLNSQKVHVVLGLFGFISLRVADPLWSCDWPAQAPQPDWARPPPPPRLQPLLLHVKLGQFFDGQTRSLSPRIIELPLEQDCTHTWKDSFLQEQDAVPSSTQQNQSAEVRRKVKAIK